MESTLLLRLQGPLQAWGMGSRFSVRETAREPTLSGVLGLLCAALGRTRSAPLDDLLSLRMGVRVDQEGRLMADFHTAREVLNAEGRVLKNAVLSTRYYLSGAIFLVGLAGEDLPLLERLQAALRAPRWLLCLGRRSFPPAAPVWLPDGLRRGEALESALQGYPWLRRAPRAAWETQKLPGRLRFVYTHPQGPLSRNDRPLSYQARLFSRRNLAVSFAAPPERFFNDENGG